MTFRMITLHKVTQYGWWPTCTKSTSHGPHGVTSARVASVYTEATTKQYNSRHNDGLPLGHPVERWDVVTARHVDHAAAAATAADERQPFWKKTWHMVSGGCGQDSYKQG